MFKGSKRASEGNTTRMTAKTLQTTPRQATEPSKGIAIGQDWRVGADTLNIILYRRRVHKKTGKEYWRAHSYYATVTNALVGLVNQGVRDTELADLKTVTKRIDEIHTWISEALENTGISTSNATSLKEATKKQNKGKTTRKRQKVSTSS